MLIFRSQLFKRALHHQLRRRGHAFGSRSTSKPNHCLFGGIIIIDSVGDNLLVALPGSVGFTGFLSFYRRARSAKDRLYFWRRVCA
jgi:hypothetical protein